MTQLEAITRLGTTDVSAILQLLRDARNAVDVNERSFLELIEAFEMSELWRALCSGTFEQALKLTHICGTARYSRWKIARAALGDAIVGEIGVAGATQAMRIENQAKQSEAIAAMRATVQKEGTVLSDQTARTIAGKWLPPRSAVLNRSRRIAELERENAQLRRRVSELEAENKLLRGKSSGPVTRPVVSKNRPKKAPAKTRRSNRSQTAV